MSDGRAPDGGGGGGRSELNEGGGRAETGRPGGGQTFFGLRRRVAVTWSTGDPVHRGAILVGGTIAAALAGAFLFGAWHVLVGYFVSGNPRAGLFGLALATIAGTLLVAVLAIARRRLPPI